MTILLLQLEVIGNAKRWVEGKGKQNTVACCYCCILTLTLTFTKNVYNYSFMITKKLKITHFANLHSNWWGIL